MVRYHYIISGAGAAGLTLLMRMIHSQQFSDKSILLVNDHPKIKNDRTWCFWEKGPGFFESIVFRRWHQLWFHSHTQSKLHEITPYTYKLIRGIDFYNYCFASIRAQPNITVRYGEVQECFSYENETGIVINGEKLYADYVFNSILFQNALLSGNHHYLLQHFTGWVISVPSPVFVPGEATLMDFRTSQQHGTTFVYVMPLSASEALVEYTILSEQLIDETLYTRGLETYCRDILKLKEYSIVEKEFGSIPMTTYPFQHSHNNLVNLGTAGGQTKASSGYTFQFVQEQTKKIVMALLDRGEPFVKPERSKKRFDFYDAVLLNILAKKKMKGEDVFDRLMSKNDMHAVMKFLENKSSVSEDLRLIRHLPKRAFLKAATEEIFKK